MLRRGILLETLCPLLLTICSTTLAVSLSGCGTPTDPSKLDNNAKLAANAAKTMVSQRGAAIVVRVALAGKFCSPGQVRLRPIVSGKIDRSRFVDIGQATKNHGPEGIGIFAKTAFQMATLNLSGAIKTVGGGDIRTSFVAIEPGQYVVTWVNCDESNKMTWMGTDRPLIFSNETGKSIPVRGDYSITIGNGQIVDAGVLDMIPDRSSDWLGKTSARLVGTEAPSAFKDAFRQNLPDLYPQTTYTRFSAQ